jgi:hypothetical protein
MVDLAASEALLDRRMTTKGWGCKPPCCAYLPYYLGAPKVGSAFTTNLQLRHLTTPRPFALPSGELPQGAEGEVVIS